jgi:hypothetical protein
LVPLAKRDIPPALARCAESAGPFLCRSGLLPTPEKLIRHQAVDRRMLLSGSLTALPGSQGRRRGLIRTAALAGRALFAAEIPLANWAIQPLFEQSSCAEG